MTWVRWLGVALAVVCPAYGRPARATPQATPRILLHLAPPGAPVPCRSSDAMPTCVRIRTAGGLYPETYYAFVLVTDASAVEGVAEARFGIHYAAATHVGVDIFAWTICGASQSPSATWPDAGSDNVVGWDSRERCQRFEPGGPGTGVVATAGYFYCAAYSPDIFSISPGSFDGVATVASCRGTVAEIATCASAPDSGALGYLCFSNSGRLVGYSPCGVSLVPRVPAAPVAPRPAVRDTLADAEVELGRLTLGPDNYLYVRGIQLMGALRCTFRSGVTYLNGLRWQPGPDPDPGSRRDSAPPWPAHPGPELLNTALERRFGRVPFVVRRVGMGQPFLRAAQEYIERSAATIEAAVRIYTRERSRLPPAGQKAAVADMLDREIATADWDDPTRYDSRSGFIVDFPGRGPYTVMFSGAAGFAMPDNAPSNLLTLQSARERFRLLGEYMRSTFQPSLAIYTATGTFMCVGNDARRALDDIARLRRLDPDSALTPRGFETWRTAVPLNFFAELRKARAQAHRPR